MIGGIRIGVHTDDPEPFMGPVISKDAADKLIEVQTDLASRGGKILAEMQRMRGIPALLSPPLNALSK